MFVSIKNDGAFKNGDTLENFIHAKRVYYNMFFGDFPVSSSKIFDNNFLYKWKVTKWKGKMKRCRSTSS